MYFAPALEDLCLKWHVPSRTAAALFVALANGAPDLASTAYMFRQGEGAIELPWKGNRPRSLQDHDVQRLCTGQGDMAFGALLGASTYVCMNVVGMIISMKPTSPMQANLALIRDIAGYLLMLLVLVPVFIFGLSRFWVIVLNGLYAALTSALPAVVIILVPQQHLIQDVHLSADFLIMSWTRQSLSVCSYNICGGRVEQTWSSATLPLLRFAGCI